MRPPREPWCPGCDGSQAGSEGPWRVALCSSIGPDAATDARSAVDRAGATSKPTTRSGSPGAGACSAPRVCLCCWEKSSEATGHVWTCSTAWDSSRRQAPVEETRPPPTQTDRQPEPASCSILGFDKPPGSDRPTYRVYRDRPRAMTTTQPTTAPLHVELPTRGSLDYDEGLDPLGGLTGPDEQPDIPRHLGAADAFSVPWGRRPAAPFLRPNFR